MRTAIILSITILFCFMTSVHGQKIKLNVIAFNPCDSSYYNDLLVYLTKDNKKFHPNAKGTIYLPEVGTYKLKVFDSDFYRLEDSVKFVTVSRGRNYDTLTRSIFTKCIIVVADASGECGYHCCDKACEGYNVDYFDNGNKKLEGHFINGNPVGQLIFYYPDGRKKEVHHYDKEGKGRIEKKETFQ